MNNKDAILKLIAEILELLHGEQPSAPQKPPTRRSWAPRVPRNGSARELLALILGILLGFLCFSIIKGCSIQNACIIRSEPADPLELIDALDLDLDAGPEIDTDFLLE